MEQHDDYTAFTAWAKDEHQNIVAAIKTRENLRARLNNLISVCIVFFCLYPIPTALGYLTNLDNRNFLAAKKDEILGWLALYGF